MMSGILLSDTLLTILNQVTSPGMNPMNPKPKGNIIQPWSEDQQNGFPSRHAVDAHFVSDLTWKIVSSPGHQEFKEDSDTLEGAQRRVTKMVKDLETIKPSKEQLRQLGFKSCCLPLEPVK